MALTRKMLKSMGIDEEKIDQIIEEHVEVTDALKGKLDAATGERDRLKKELDGAAEEGGKEWKDRYEAERKAFAAYKAEAEAEKGAAQVRALYRSELEGLGITGARADAVLKVTDLSKVETEGGKLKDPEAVRKAIESEWAEFIPQKRTEGAGVANPPAGGGKAKTMGEIAEMKNPRERQAEIAKLLESEGE